MSLQASHSFTTHLLVELADDFSIGLNFFIIGGRNEGQHQIPFLSNDIVAKNDIVFGHVSLFPF
ncbi:MAG: hypothetical protein KBT06_02380 [Prevotellaceae bacterium]|nr:hypothetical protein [Candidatus Colivivens equi]